MHLFSMSSWKNKASKQERSNTTDYFRVYIFENGINIDFMDDN